jgi:molecular chaperone DnaK
MAADNRTLGRFELTGIPPAPRGLPQIEVTFDIDANGNVSRIGERPRHRKRAEHQDHRVERIFRGRDRQTVKEAEAHGEEDKKKKELIELKNQADSMIYSTEKNLKEMETDRRRSESRIEDSIAKLKKAMEGG